MIVLIILAVIVTAILLILLRVFKNKQTLIFKVSSLVPITLLVARIIYRAFYFRRLDIVLQGLPFQMCGIAAIMLPIVAFKKIQIIFDITYFFSLPGTIAALALDTTASTNLADFEMWSFAIPHILYGVLPVLFIVNGFMRPKIKNIKLVLVAVLCIVVVVHLLNIIINAAVGYMAVNYIFTVFPGDTVAETGQMQELPILGTLYHLFNETAFVYLIPLFPVMLAIFYLLCLPLIKKQSYARFFTSLRNLFNKPSASPAQTQEDSISEPSKSDIP